MELKVMNCLFAAMVVTGYSFANSLSYVHQMEMNNVVVGDGKIVNCGKNPFNLTWSPDPVSPSEPLKVHVDYIVPHTLKGGSYSITIWFHGEKDPILEFADSFDCSKIKKYIPCPLNKGWHINKSKVFEHIPNIGSYPGDYDVEIVIHNQDKKEMLCMKAHVPISKG